MARLRERGHVVDVELEVREVRERVAKIFDRRAAQVRRIGAQCRGQREVPATASYVRKYTASAAAVRAGKMPVPLELETTVLRDMAREREL